MTSGPGGLAKSMPDWLAHVLFAYVVCKLIGLRYKLSDRADVALVLIGALLPDITKMRLVLGLAGIDIQDMIEPLHTPAGSLLLAGLIALLFFDSRRVFLLLALGAGTHFTLDLMEDTVGGGVLLLFPLSWQRYGLGLIPNDDWRIGALIAALALAGMMIRWTLQRIAR